MISRAFAFAVRSIEQRRTYRAALLMDALAIVVVGLTFYFLGRFVDGHSTRVPDRHGYFAFVLVGLAVAMLQQRALRGFTDAVRQGQLAGTLETLFLAPIGAWEIVVWDGLVEYTAQALKLAGLMGVAFLLGWWLPNVNWTAVAVVSVLTTAAFCPLGIFAAAAVLTWQKGDPVGYALSALSTLVAGVYYPVDVLPPALRAVSVALPMTHAIEAFRGALLWGQSTALLWRPCLALVVFAAVMLPISSWTLALAVSSAKRRGTLSRY